MIRSSRGLQQCNSLLTLHGLCVRSLLEYPKRVCDLYFFLYLMKILNIVCTFKQGLNYLGYRMIPARELAN